MLNNLQYREAHEEVGLPLDHPGVHTLCILRPFIAWTRSFVLVTPVVALLTDLSVLEDLRAAPGEVDLIYDHPLEALLDPQLSKAEPLVDLNSELWPSGDPFYVGSYITAQVTAADCMAFPELCR